MLSRIYLKRLLGVVYSHHINRLLEPVHYLLKRISFKNPWRMRLESLGRLLHGYRLNWLVEPFQIDSSDIEPTSQRQAELLRESEANRLRGIAPYTGVEIRTRGELLLIKRLGKWSTAPGAIDKELRSLGQVDLAGLDLSGANLTGVDLSGTDLTGANLRGAILTEANLDHAIIREVNLSHAYLNEASLIGADLTGVNLSNAHLNYATLSAANLTNANLSNADLTGTDLSSAHFVEAILINADLTEANLSSAYFNRAVLSQAMLCRTNLEGVHLNGAFLHGADLQQARMDTATVLEGIELDTETKLGDVIWNGVSLAQVDWTKVPQLGDEAAIQKAKVQGRWRYIDACHKAARAYHGLAIVLREQGLSIEASKYRLRERRLERQALFADRKIPQGVMSWVLDLIAGYGYEPWKSVIAYLLVVSLFAMAYLVVTPGTYPTWNDILQVFAESMTAFHGRGVFPVQLEPYDWREYIAAFEAVIGLIMEVIFIVAFTRRFLD